MNASVIPPAGLSLERASEADCAGLAALARDAHSHPWSVVQYRDSLAVGHQIWLLRARSGDITACCVASQLFDEMEILDVAVSSRWRRQGLAECLLQNVLNRLPEEIARVLLDVRVSNHPALGLYRKLGFVEDGRRKNYYPTVQGGREDALLMSLVV